MTQMDADWEREGLGGIHEWDEEDGWSGERGALAGVGETNFATADSWLPSNDVMIMRWAIPILRGLMVFSDQINTAS